MFDATLQPIVVSIQRLVPGAYVPWAFLTLFLVSSLLMIWRLESMNQNGLEGTVLGTLVMPYCSGLGNLVFAFVLGRNGGNSAEIITNSLVNNATNLTLLLGLPSLIWGLRLLASPEEKGKKKKKKGTDNAPQIN